MHSIVFHSLKVGPSLCHFVSVHFTVHTCLYFNIKASSRFGLPKSIEPPGRALAQTAKTSVASLVLLLGLLLFGASATRAAIAAEVLLDLLREFGKEYPPLRPLCNMDDCMHGSGTVLPVFALFRSSQDLVKDDRASEPVRNRRACFFTVPTAPAGRASTAPAFRHETKHRTQNTCSGWLAHVGSGNHSTDLGLSHFPRIHDLLHAGATGQLTAAQTNRCLHDLPQL